MFTITTDQELKDFNDAVKAGEVTDIKMLSDNKLTFRMDNDNHTLQFLPKYLTKLNYGQPEIVDIIYGKNPYPHLVSVHYKDNNIHLFTENDGKVNEQVLPYNYWVLSNIGNAQTKSLIGNNHYNRIRFYENQAEFEQYKQNIYKYKLYTINDEVESFLTLFGLTYFKGMKKEDVSTLSFDIETTGLNPKAKNAKVLLITNTFRKNGEIKRKTFNLKNYDNDMDMINSWCKWVREIDPSLIVGHNIISFDLPYLIERAGELLLGRDGSNIQVEARVRELRKDGSQSYSYNRKKIFGREIIDTFFLAIKYDIGRKYESYGLKPIIRAEGLEKKGRTFVDASKMLYYFENDLDMWNNAVKYAEEDSDDALMLFDLMITAFFFMTQMIPKTFQNMLETATGSQLNSLMVRSYLQKGMSIPKADEKTEYEGAISIGVPGIYKNCVKYDVASLYPSIMVEYNIEHKQKDFNGHFQKITKYLREERLKNKKLAKDTGDRYYDDLQNTQKVLINSLYGFLGASGLNFNYPEGAAAVTRYGREILSKAIKWATGNDVSKYQHKEENNESA